MCNVVSRRCSVEGCFKIPTHISEVSFYRVASTTLPVTSWVQYQRQSCMMVFQGRQHRAGVGDESIATPSSLVNITRMSKQSSYLHLVSIKTIQGSGGIKTPTGRIRRSSNSHGSDVVGSGRVRR